MPLYRQYAKVKGHGEFPVDMLRYDRCCPHSESDSYGISHTFRNYEKEWEVELVRYVVTKDAKWTVERWQSFTTTLTPLPHKTEKVS